MDEFDESQLQSGLIVRVFKLILTREFSLGSKFAYLCYFVEQERNSHVNG